MTSLARIFLDDEPDEPWFCEPRDKLGLSEDARQQEFLRLLPYVAPGLLVWAVPNAGKRTRWEANKRRREGMRAGVPDLTVVWNHGCAFVEFKNGTEQPAQEQRDMLNRLHRAGHRCGLFRTAPVLFAQLGLWGAPVQMRVLEGLRP